MPAAVAVTDLQPPAKRPRTEEHPRQGTEQTSDTPFHPSAPELWFEDGSIIIVCDPMGFRVHKSILALNSVVFKDMLELADEPSDCDETFEDCAIVRLQDDPRDMQRLLQALYYPRKYARKGEIITFETLVSLFKLTKKYAFDELHKELIEHMKIMFPTDLGWYHSEESDAVIPDDYDVTIAVELGIKYNIPSIMPLACYETARSPVEYLLDAPRLTFYNGARMVLERATERVCLLFRERLRDIVAQALEVVDLDSNPWTEDPVTGADCPICGGITDVERQAIELPYRTLEVDIFRDLWSPEVDSRSMETFKELRGSPGPTTCSICSARLRSFDQEVGQKIWDRLPEACDYDDWHAVYEAQVKSSSEI